MNIEELLKSSLICIKKIDQIIDDNNLELKEQIQKELSQFCQVIQQYLIENVDEKTAALN